MRLSLLFSLFLYFFFLWVSPSSSEDLLCFQYILQNECSTVLGAVAIGENEQEDFFNENVSLTVSDIRMFNPSCRRPFLSYYCQLMFGSFLCQSSSLEEQICLEEEYCRQVSASCSHNFPLDCSSSSSSSSSNLLKTSHPSPPPSPCQEKVTQQLDQVAKTPIIVQTCLNSSKETIECCLGPFIFDEFDECVIECPQYIYGEKFEFWSRNATFVLLGLTEIVFLVALIPMFMMNNLMFPNNVLFLFYGFYILSITPYTWSVFAGGTGSYICGDETNYILALDHYGSSNRTMVQYSIGLFFTLTAFSLWVLFAFHLLCNSMRPFTPIMEKFIVQPVKPYIQFLTIGSCILFPFSITIFVLFYDPFRVEARFFPAPIFSSPFSRNEKENDFLTTIYVVLDVCGVSFFFIAIALFLKRGRQIFYYQWRSFLAGGFWFIISIIFVFTLVYPPPTSIALLDYIGCVVSHPRISPTECPKGKDFVSMYFLVADFLVIVLFLILLVVSFSTSKQIVGWWKALLLRNSSSSSPPKYEIIGD